MGIFNLNATGRMNGGLAQVVSTNQAAQAEANTNKFDTSLKLKEYERLSSEKKDAYSRINMKLDGFQRDITGELAQGKNELRAFAREQFRIKGVNDETITAIDQAAQKLEQKVSLAVQQRDLVKKYKEVLAKTNASKSWDIEKSLQHIDEFKGLDIEKRPEYSKPLLVPASEEFTAYDLPKALISPDHKKSGFKPWVFEVLSSDKTAQQHYQAGLEAGKWKDPNEFFNFVERVNDFKYKDRVAGSSAVKFDFYGDPSKVETAQNMVIKNGEEPAERVYTIGKDMVVTAVTPIFPKKDENYGKVTYMDENGNVTTGQLGKVRAEQYFQDTETGKHYLKVYKTTKVEMDPKDVDERLVDSEMFNPSTVSKLQGFKTMEEKREQIRKDIAKKSVTKKESVYFIELGDDNFEEQKSLRPNLFSAHIEASQQGNFINNSGEDSYERFRQTVFKTKPSATETKIDSTKLKELL